MVEEDCRKCKVPTRALHQLHRDLQTRGKCFSGAQLVAWILRNADLFLSADELSLCGGRTSLSAQGAADIAQQLLDLQFIRDVEAELSCELGPAYTHRLSGFCRCVCVCVCVCLCNYNMCVYN